MKAIKTEMKTSDDVMEKQKEEMGNFLRNAREKSGLTQIQISHKIGLSTQQYVSNFERGFCFPTTEAIKVYIKECKLSKKELKKLMLRQLSERIDKELE